MRDLLDYSVFVDVPDNIRCIRRRHRDINIRGYTSLEVSIMYENVRNMYRILIEPYDIFANIQVKEN